MQKILDFIERNNLEITLSFYLIFLIFGWSFLTGLLFPYSGLVEKINLYFFYVSGFIFIVYLLIQKRKSSQFLLFIPVRFVFFYFFFQIIMLFRSGHKEAILNRQKYECFDEFIVELYDLENYRVSLVTNFLNKILK